MRVSEAEHTDPVVAADDGAVVLYGDGYSEAGEAVGAAGCGELGERSWVRAAAVWVAHPSSRYTAMGPMMISSKILLEIICLR